MCYNGILKEVGIMSQNMLPRLVYQMCVHGGLIVGSNAKRLAGEKIEGDPNDWDVICPLEKWQTISLLIPETAKPNKFGGWRFEMEDGMEIDVWPGSVMEYLTNCKSTKGGRVIALDFIHNRIYSSEFVKE
jgi:hypothetical protein